MRKTLIIALFALTSSPSLAQQVRIGVLSLFRPRELVLRAPAASALVVRAGQESLVLERSSGGQSAEIRLDGGNVLARVGSRELRAPVLRVSARDGQSSDFVLSVPGKLTRHYRGMLEVEASSGTLLATVTMDLETAVASVVAAESATDTPLEALKAQAVAVRTYLVAGRGRHHEFDFCDTTHCQFLREPPAPGTAAMQATVATRDLVLAFQSAPFPAMYTRSCSGETRTPADVKLPSGIYPYYAVECRYCREHPMRWQTRVSARDAATLRSSDEPGRLSVVRVLGWSAVPSTTFTMRSAGSSVVLDGVGQGHGIGLCQAGAKAMAEGGADFRTIIGHYYPNTTLITVHG